MFYITHYTPPMTYSIIILIPAKNAAHFLLPIPALPARLKYSICLLYTLADTAFWLCRAVLIADDYYQFCQ